MSNLPAKINIDDSGIVGTTTENSPAEKPFLPRLQILYANSDVISTWDANNDVPKPQPGTFWLGPPGGETLGTSFIGIPCAIRDHALQLKNGEVSLESFRRSSGTTPPKDKDESIFNQIENAPKQQDKKINRWGYDALIWIPAAKSFAIIFLHSTARPVGKDCRTHKGQFCRFRVYTPPSNNYVWYIPEITPIKQIDQLDPSKDTFLPQDNLLQQELVKFKNPVARGEGRENETGVDGRPR